MTYSVYYNEIDAYCAQWLRILMDADLIPRGDIDTRSIEDVRPDELRGYDHCHFFAGLGGWPLALALAGWPPGRSVWTGSCPCQPFSAAGKGDGFADQRHLWPAWYHLIRQNRWWLEEYKRSTPAIFGEQVANATQWVRLVRSDLEALELAVGFMPIEAASAGADHLRDRFWFVADTGSTGLAQRERERGILRTLGGQSQGEDAADDGGFVGHAHGITSGQGSALDSRGDQGSGTQPRSGLGSNDGCSVMADADKLGAGEGWQQRSRQFGGAGSDPSAHHGWIIGHDGKARRIEPSIRLLADGVPARVGKLRALGNAIDPRPAATFITAYMQARGLIANQQAVAA